MATMATTTMTTPFVLMFISSVAALLRDGTAVPVRSVLIMRHCVRSTPASVYGDPSLHFTSQDNYTSASHPFPEWPVSTYECIPGALEMVRQMGRDLAGTLPGPLLLRVDGSTKRTNDTALALLDGLGSDVPRRQIFDNKLFNPAFAHGHHHHDCSKVNATTKAALLKQQLADFPAPSGHAALLRALQGILGEGAAPPLEDLPDRIYESGDFNGGSSVGSEIAETFLMQLGGSLPVAWGLMKPEQVYDFLALRTWYRAINDRILGLIRRSHSYMAHEVMSFLTAKADSPAPRTTIIVGHDGDQDAIAELFGIRWHTAPFPENATTPGSALRFDLDADNQVSVSVIYQRFDGDAMPRPHMQSVPATFTWSGKASESLSKISDWLMGRISKKCTKPTGAKQHGH